MKLSFETKAETLEQLSFVIKSAKILPQIRFTVEQWKKSSNDIIQKISLQGWLMKAVIVRSSAINEDAYGQSMAGHFTSILNVQGINELTKAIEEVIASFGDDSQDDQVFVQPMLENVIMSGVAFTRDPSTGGYYYVINYDDMSGSTSSITSGSSNEGKVFYALKSEQACIRDNRIIQVINLLAELEEIFDNDCLDIEFAINYDELYLLQVRPLVCNINCVKDKEFFKEVINEIYQKHKLLNHQHPYLYGSRTIFGVMPDWNPAEMIGIRPRPLALSLYKEMITDSIWAFQRSNYGYRNLRSFPLLLSLHGMPYIDVRVDFNSFIPEDMDSDMAERLVNHYIDCLEKNPSYHDKIEFEIVYTCYTLDLPERIRKLKDAGFSDDDCQHITKSLKKLTNAIINDTNGHWRQDINRIEQLDMRYHTVRKSEMDNVSKIYWLLEDCKRYGTLPFAGLARAAFIATQIMQSMVSVGVIDNQEYQNFMSELDGIGTKMSKDFNELNKETFIEKYGHLRPGTYDILSPRYDEAPERYFQWNGDRTGSNGKNNESFVLSLEQIRKVKDLLNKHQLQYDVLELFEFIKIAIESREYAKFIFTRSLSDAIFLLKELGQKYGFSDEECSYAKIDCIKTLYDSCKNISTVLRKSIHEGMEEYEITKHITLPPLILQPEDVWAFEMPAFQPNYVTLKRTTGHVVFKEQDHQKFNNAILMIPSADPGYDWIFSHGIAGFITMYGGVNSHMAVRAGELGIPAIIGAGEVLYEKWAQGKVLEIDCANRQVKIIK